MPDIQYTINGQIAYAAKSAVEGSRLVLTIYED